MIDIPHTSVTFQGNYAKLKADDGHEIMANRYEDGSWHIMNDASGIPSRACHFDLRKQFMQALEGVIP